MGKAKKSLLTLLCVLAVFTVFLGAGLKAFAADETSVGEEYLVKIKDKGYNMFSEAFSSAVSGDEIVLQKDVTTSEYGLVAAGKVLTFDFNGYNITATSVPEWCEFFSVYGAGADFTLKNSETTGGILDVTSSTENLSRPVCGICFYESSYAKKVTVGENVTIKAQVPVSTASYSSLDVKGKLYGNYVGIMGNGTNSGTEINIYDGAEVISATNMAVYHPQDGVMNVYGGVIEGTTAIYMKGGSLNVYNGVITGNGEFSEYEPSGNGAYATGDGIVIDSCGYHDGKIPVANIYGGNFISEQAGTSALAGYTKDGSADPAISVENGSFSSEIPLSYVAAGSKLVTVDGVTTVSEGVARIEETGTVYNTLEEAFAAVENGQTITLLGNARGNGIKVPSGSNFTFDLGGFTYLIDGTTVGSAGTETNGFQLLKDSALTFKNGKIESTKAAILIQNYSDLTLENIELNLNNPDRFDTYTLSNNNGDTVLKAGTKVINGGTNGVAFDVCYYANYPSVSVTVESGVTVSGKVEITTSAGRPGFAENAALQVASDVELELADNLFRDESGKVIVKTAEVGGQYYATLDEAFAAANDGAKVTLLENTVLSQTIEVGENQNLTFDLNGKNITVVKTGDRSLYAINNYGTLVIEDSVGTGKITARGIQNLGSGNLTIESGTFVSCDSNGGAAIWNEADLIINGGTFNTVYVGTSGDQYGPGCLNNSGIALITGGRFESVNRRVYSIISTGEIKITPAQGKEVTVIGAHGGLGIDSGTAEVNGGSYSSSEYYGLYVSNDGYGEDPMQAAVTVNDGVFTGKEYSVWVGSDYNDPVNSTIAITGGTFEKPLNAQEGARDGAISVSGGEFYQALDSKYCALGFEPKYDESTGKYGVEDTGKTDRLKITSATLELNEIVHIVYFATATELMENYEMGILVFDNMDDAINYNISAALQNIRLVKREDGRFEAVTDGIAAKNMGDSQFTVIYAIVDGEYIFGTQNVIEYSALIYAQNKKDDPTVGKLVAALMNYGAAAQIQFNYKESTLMNEGFDATEFDDSVLSGHDVVIDPENGSLNGFTAYSATMELNGAVEYIFSYMADETLEGKTLYLEYSVEGSISGVTELISVGGGKYEAKIPGLAAKNLDRKVTVKAFYLDGENKVYGPSVTYSAYVYANRIISNPESEETLKDLTRALIAYQIEAAKVLLAVA